MMEMATVYDMDIARKADCTISGKVGWRCDASQCPLMLLTLFDGCDALLLRVMRVLLRVMRVMKVLRNPGRFC
jgi:hypothetical protein